MNIGHLRYKMMPICDRDAQIASHLVRTKVCPVAVRLVVIRTRPKHSKPYRYFLVFTTDLTLQIPKIVEYYRHRQEFGFSAYRVKSRKSINRFVQLSFSAATFTKLIFSMPHPTQKTISPQEVCDQLSIHWYHPRKLTQGLRVAYLQAQITKGSPFSTSATENTNSQNISTSFQQETTLPFDKAA